MECKNPESHGQTEQTHIWDDCVPMDHPRVMWNTVEKNGEITTSGGHKLYYSTLFGKHEKCLGFTVHTDIKYSVMGCKTIYNRIIIVQLKTTPFYITIHCEALCSDYKLQSPDIVDQFNAVVGGYVSSTGRFEQWKWCWSADRPKHSSKGHISRYSWEIPQQTRDTMQ